MTDAPSIAGLGGGGDPPTDDEDEVEPVEVLVQLAKDGEIDPWDIDIVEVTDKFLARLDESDLRTSGRALFYASVLLRMKGDALLEDDEEEEAPEPWEVELGMAPAPESEDAPVGPDPIDSLEAEIERRIDRKRARGTPETLDELVRELREAERDTWWKEKRTYDTSESPSGYARGTQTLDYHTGDEFRAADEPTEEDVTATAHKEDMETTIAEVELALNEQYDRGRDEVLFAEIRTTAGLPVETYLGVLFLSHRGEVYLRQDQLFGDLWIQDPDAFDAPAPANGDPEAEDLAPDEVDPEEDDPEILGEEDLGDEAGGDETDGEDGSGGDSDAES